MPSLQGDLDSHAPHWNISANGNHLDKGIARHQGIACAKANAITCFYYLQARLHRPEFEDMAHTPSGFVVAVVDKDENVLRALADLLECANYEVRLFTSGTALVESGCLPQIGCLISDIDAPGMEGFDLLARIHVARPALPTILITNDPESVERLPNLGGLYPGLFTKPCHPEELLAAVKDVLRDSRE
jgi:CheY-like chemotaxis protein